MTQESDEKNSGASAVEPRIVVDDDWKAQVQHEKEVLEEQRATEEPDPEIPEASFAMLVTTMATQALANLGHLPDPIEGKPVIRKPLAKHFIDTLAMLEEKTKGNLDQNELGMLDNTLHQLRMAFVSAPESMPEGDAVDPKPKSSTIELPS